MGGSRANERDVWQRAGKALCRRTTFCEKLQSLKLTVFNIFLNEGMKTLFDLLERSGLMTKGGLAWGF